MVVMNVIVRNVDRNVHNFVLSLKFKELILNIWYPWFLGYFDQQWKISAAQDFLFVFVGLGTIWAATSTV